MSRSCVEFDRMNSREANPDATLGVREGVKVEGKG
jgi:hypothetical protein